MIARRRFLAIAAAALARPARAETAAWQGRAFGAEARITLSGPRGLPGATLARIGAEIERIERLFSLARPDSALVALNAAGRLDPAPPDLLDLLGVAGRVHLATGGLFDPTVQPLWRALAEGRDPVPARAAIGWDRVRVSGQGVALEPGQALTLNGIAQGWAADRIRALLAAAGFTRALVDMGEFAALGGPWRLAVEDPGLGRIGHRTLLGGAMATSSPGALRLGAETHILGPRGERPCWSTISLRSQSAALADAAATALVLAPRDELPAILARLPEPVAVLAVSPGGEVESFAT
ncbi:FAD:protein FMN transferase [Frigidibacter sp. MR17.24]|uniref:FAD:protein FMN transferase n=1 Tax=Frigidibacter sp. MR17.24 TaxID=3127345 RepID=UPI003012B959